MDHPNGGKTAAHNLHSQNCKCQAHDSIDHDVGCVAYQNFFDTLTKGFDSKDEEENLKLIETQSKIEGFLRAPLKLPLQDVNQKNKMCCCCSHIPHDET